MLEPNGRQILTIIGKSPDGANAKGILLPVDMPGAIVALQEAVAQDEQKRAQMVDEARAAGEAAPKPEGISLKQRAQPMIEMLKRCHKADKEIVWGV